MQTLFEQLFFKGKIARTRVYKNHLKMVKGCRIDTGQYKKALSKKGSSKNTWNKGELQNRYMARWAKGKTGIGLDGHRARQSLIGLSVHCANSYIPQHIRIMCCT